MAKQQQERTAGSLGCGRHQTLGIGKKDHDSDDHQTPTIRNRSPRDAGASKDEEAPYGKAAQPSATLNDLWDKLLAIDEDAGWILLSLEKKLAKHEDCVKKTRNMHKSV